MKKIIRLIIIVLLLFSFFLYFYLRPNTYTMNYNIDEANITESYDKKAKLYTIAININDTTYTFYTADKYTPKRKLITKINAYDNCLKAESEHLKLYSLCQKDNEFVMESLLNEDNNNSPIEIYENINVYDYLDKTYLLWNYHNLFFINKETEKEYPLFDKDYYNLRLTYATDRYLFIPNQDNEYTFNDINIIDAKKNNLKNVKLDRDIYFDSYILGNKKNSIYLVDRKNKQEYEINLAKAKLFKTSGKVLENNKWQEVSLTKLINNNYKFTNDYYISYELDGNDLYIIINNQKLKITDKKISTIVKTNKEEIYYLSKDTLYYFNLYEGEKKLLSYKEWEFNYNNMIFIFD